MLTAARTIGEMGTFASFCNQSHLEMCSVIKSPICSSGHAVQEQGSCFASYRAEHSDVAHSCPELARPPWAVFRR